MLMICCGMQVCEYCGMAALRDSVAHISNCKSTMGEFAEFFKNAIAQVIPNRMRGGIPTCPFCSDTVRKLNHLQSCVQNTLERLVAKRDQLGKVTQADITRFLCGDPTRPYRGGLPS